jgi:hypothetical protein
MAMRAPRLSLDDVVVVRRKGAVDGEFAVCVVAPGGAAAFEFGDGSMETNFSLFEEMRLVDWSRVLATEVGGSPGHWLEAALVAMQVSGGSVKLPAFDKLPRGLTRGQIVRRWLNLASDGKLVLGTNTNPGPYPIEV